MPDSYINHEPGLSSPGRQLRAVTPNDSTDLPDGVCKALDAVQKITGAKQMNALGFCIGGAMEWRRATGRYEQKDKFLGRELTDATIGPLLERFFRDGDTQVLNLGAIDAVLARLAELGFDDVEDVDAVEEHMVFALPQELRRDLKAAGKQ